VNFDHQVHRVLAERYSGPLGVGLDGVDQLVVNSVELDEKKDVPEIVVVFRHSRCPEQLYGLRFPAHDHADPEHREWSPDEWAGVITTNLIELVEAADLGLPAPDAPGRVIWVG
jgi:hypothetical protein